MTVRILLLSIFFWFAAPLEMADAAPPRVGVVYKDVVQIYAKPDLDSQVVTVVPRATRLPISKGVRGDYAKFYRTRANGKLGWVLTIDVKSEKAAKKYFIQEKAAEYKRGPFADESDESSRRSEKEMFVFTRSASFSVGMINYKESISDRDYSENLLTYGLKLTGPDILIDGPLMDVNLALHYGAPGYYSALSATQPFGFIMWFDANLLLPIFFRDDVLIGLGAGPILVISNIQTTQAGRDPEVWGFNFGADIELTSGFRFDGFCVRLDGKYIFEKKTYQQIQLSLGTVF